MIPVQIHLKATCAFSRATPRNSKFFCGHKFIFFFFIAQLVFTNMAVAQEIGRASCRERVYI